MNAILRDLAGKFILFKKELHVSIFPPVRGWRNYYNFKISHEYKDAFNITFCLFLLLQHYLLNARWQQN